MKKLTKEEALKNIAELTKYVEGLETEELEIPSNIKFEDTSRYCISEGGDGLAIIFENGAQELAYDEGFYKVRMPNTENIVPCKLIKVSKDELKKGYTYFMSDTNDASLEYREYYGKYLGDGQQAYIDCDGLGITVGYCNYSNIYQVVPK